ncbi:MAG: hypothetical protein E4H09_02120, partial [Spirochaetales bacterium]
LYRLRDILMDELIAAGQLTRYTLENIKVQNKPPQPDRGPGLLRSGRFFGLSKQQQQLFRRIYEERDPVARDLNLPPNSVLANSVMFAVVTGESRTDELRPARNVPTGTFAKLMDRIDLLLKDSRSGA